MGYGIKFDFGSAGSTVGIAGSPWSIVIYCGNTVLVLHFAYSTDRIAGHS